MAWIESRKKQSGGGGEKGLIVFASTPAIIPFKDNSDYEIFIEYEMPFFVRSCVIGTSGGQDAYLHLTPWGETSLYAGKGNGEQVISTTQTDLYGRHTFKYNHDGGIYFDDVYRTTASPTNSQNISIAGRGSYRFSGVIWYASITSISTGDLVCELVPREVNGTAGLYDTINDEFYPLGSYVLEF